MIRVDLFAPLAIALLVGCGAEEPVVRSNRALAAGVVKFQGNPLSGGFITFVSKADPLVVGSGTILEDGTFQLGDAPLGPVAITIDNQHLKALAPETYVKLPARYSNVEKSNLQHDIQPGMNDNIELNLE